jgi:hypothetical protein
LKTLSQELDLSKMYTNHCLRAKKVSLNAIPDTNHGFFTVEFALFIS